VRGKLLALFLRRPRAKQKSSSTRDALSRFNQRGETAQSDNYTQESCLASTPLKEPHCCAQITPCLSLRVSSRCSEKISWLLLRRSGADACRGANSPSFLLRGVF
ncbi:hypothetical protein TSAR_015868, partial [Trichomalopsis sarcophagae]